MSRIITKIGLFFFLTFCLIKKLQSRYTSGQGKNKASRSGFLEVYASFTIWCKKPFTAFAPQPFLPSQRLFIDELKSRGQTQDFKCEKGYLTKSSLYAVSNFSKIMSNLTTLYLIFTKRYLCMQMSIGYYSLKACVRRVFLYQKHIDRWCEFYSFRIFPFYPQTWACPDWNRPRRAFR